MPLPCKIPSGKVHYPLRGALPSHVAALSKMQELKLELNKSFLFPLRTDSKIVAQLIRITYVGITKKQPIDFYNKLLDFCRDTPTRTEDPLLPKQMR